MKFWPMPRVYASADLPIASGDATPSAEESTPPTLAPLPSDAMIVVPLPETVLFPGVLSPVTLRRPSSIAAVQEAIKRELPVGFLLQRNPEQVEIRPEDLYLVGTQGPIVRYITGSVDHHLVVQGNSRFEVLEFLEGWPFLVARVALIEQQENNNPAIEARLHQLKEQTITAIELLPNVPDELIPVIQNIASAEILSHMVGNLIDIRPEEKQNILETFNLTEQLDLVIELLAERVNVLKLSREIGEKTRAQFNERQREHVLREQLRQIQKELGEDEDVAAEVEELKKAIEAAGMPEEVATHTRKEHRRLQRTSESSGEYAMLRTYLEWLTELPWRHDPGPPIDIAHARKVLDDDHFGLAKIKQRILEYLAVHKLNPKGRSAILCFVGPPGVGKTSLGQSIAHATGRAFQRVALGGVHDEAEIRGHRRTYLGALPGNIIQAIRRAKTHNLVLMLDEIDKLGRGSLQGDPSSALLEVLDPEQNYKFHDNYLGIDFDLSHIMFICTANLLDTIDEPLLDRMEIVQLPGYTEEEKLQIAQRYLIQRQLEANGLHSHQVRLTHAALKTLIANYTREAGVRNLEREIGAVLRHSAMQIVEGKYASITIDTPDLAESLGPQRFENEVALRTSVAGVATGLAWTAAGGDILFIEATKIPGRGNLILTGHLGEVMKESAHTAFSLTKKLANDPLSKVDIHIHVPAGATPKDGPSAGVAMFVALTSLLKNKPVRANVAMTGEISLSGSVLPIGGVKEKTLAASRSGITTVMLPKRNKKDLEDIPKEARDKLQFVWLQSITDALNCALEDEPEKKAKPRRTLKL